MQIDENSIKKALEREYGIEARIHPLPGELDLNFDIHTSTLRYVLKVMRAECSPDFVDMQIKAMDHIRQSGCPVRVPEIIPTRSGSKYFRHDNRVCWLISFLPGRVMANVQPWTPALAHNIGRSIAKIVDALAGFDHPQLDRPLKWNLLNSLWIKDHVKVIGDTPRRIMIGEIIDRFETDIRPRLAAMPAVPIYNDANDMNVLVGPDGESVNGIIDFGDMTRAPKVCEPAIAMAYAMMGEGDAIARGTALAAGFHKIFRLSNEEIDMLVPLVKMRLANSVTNAVIERAAHPENAYLSISEAPAWALLEMLAKMDETDLTDKIKIACQDARS